MDFLVSFFRGAWVGFGALKAPRSLFHDPASLQAPWRGGQCPLAGSRLQHHHENLSPMPHTCTGSPPTFLSSSSKAHLLEISLIGIAGKITAFTHPES